MKYNLLAFKFKKMKKLIYNGTLVLFALSGIFWSCQNDELLNPEIEGTLKSEVQQNFDCINADGPYCEMADLSYLQQWDDNKKSKQISYVAYNTDVNFEVKIKAMGNFDEDATYTVTVNFGNTDVVLVKTHKGAGEVGTFVFDLPSGWQGGNLVSLKILQEGGNNPVTFASSYYLVGICQD